MPPQPPAGRSENTSARPWSSTQLATNQFASAQVEPVTRSGIALASACQIALVIFDAVSVVQPMVGAGHVAFSQQP